MSFEEIAERLGMKKSEVIKIYKQAMRKLKKPSNENQEFWNYSNISSHPDNKD